MGDYLSSISIDINKLAVKYYKKLFAIFFLIKKSYIYVKKIMGCNCKGGKEQVLNNLQSKDHLNVAIETFKELENVDITNMDNLQLSMLMNAFYTIYPNVKTEVSREHAFNTIKTIYKNSNGK